MNREEMLKKLHAAKIAAQPITITMDMGLQYEYVTPEGCGCGFGNMGEWPAYLIRDMTNDILHLLQQKIKSKTLTLEDMAGTDLEKLCNAVTDIPRMPGYIFDPNVFFEGMLEIKSIRDDNLYVICDIAQQEPAAILFETYEEFERAFANMYITNIERWEDCDDESLENWLKRIEAELYYIPFSLLDAIEDLDNN